MEGPYKDYDAYFEAQTHTFKSHESDVPRWLEGQERFIDAWVMTLPRHVKILDVSCGDGHGIKSLLDRGFTDITGIEWSPDKAKRARAHGCPVHVADMHDLGMIEEQSVDVVYSIHTLEHAVDPKKVLREFHRVLQPAGVFLLVLPYVDKGPIEAHCGQEILGTTLDDDAAKLTGVLMDEGWQVLMKKYDSFREPEVWLKLAKSP